MLNPGVWKSNPDDSITQPLLFDVFRPGVLLLKEPPAQCNLGTIVQSNVESSGRFYMLEERLELLENTLENPAATGVTGGKCPTVPKTFLNEHSCKLLPGCLALGQQGLTVSLTLDTLAKFFSVGGRYIYVVSGLRTTASPCGKVSRWKQLACPSACVASDLENATAETIRTSIQQAADQGNVRDIGLSCSGVDAGSIVQVGDVFSSTSTTMKTMSLILQIGRFNTLGGPQRSSSSPAKAILWFSHLGIQWIDGILE